MVKKYNDYEEYYDYDYNNYWEYNNYDDCVSLNLGKRILAKIIDFFIFVVFHYFIVNLYTYYFIQSLETKYILIGLFLCILLNAIIEFLIIPSFIFRGQSIGKRIVKIKTITKQGLLVSFKEMIVEFIFLFLIPIDIIYCVKNKEFLHNKVCETYVEKIKY